MTPNEVRLVLVLSALWVALGTILVVRARAMKAEASVLFAQAIERENAAYERHVRNNAAITEFYSHVHALARMEFGVAMQRSAIISARVVQS